MVSLELEARLDNLLSTAQKETAHIDLFAPIEEREECPVCLLPFPHDEKENVFMSCCGKTVCCGCVYKNMMVESKNGVRDHKCAFCRQEQTNSIKSLKRLMKRNDPEAFIHMAMEYGSGERTLQSDTKSIEMYIRAAELGNSNAFVTLGNHYRMGSIVERDALKSLEYYEIAAKKGSVEAHKYLAGFHGRNGNDHERIEHLKVVASAGDQIAMGDLMWCYKDQDDLISKEDLARTLRTFQTSSNEMKSKDRENARSFEEARKKGEAPPAHLLADDNGQWTGF